MVPLLFMSIGYPAMWSKWLELTTEVILRGFVSRAVCSKKKNPWGNGCSEYIQHVTNWSEV